MIWLPASWYSKYINRQEVSKSPKMPILPIEMELRKKKKVVHGGKGSLGIKWPDLLHFVIIKDMQRRAYYSVWLDKNCECLLIGSNFLGQSGFPFACLYLGEIN